LLSRIRWVEERTIEIPAALRQPARQTRAGVRDSHWHAGKSKPERAARVLLRPHTMERESPLPVVARRLVMLGGVAGVLSGGQACSAASDTGRTKDDDSVVVDFYRGGLPSAACAGTLVSDRLVLIAAHCADQSEGARVTVAGEATRTAEVALVVPYDWTDDMEHHAQEHDIALLVLRRPLVARTGARLSTDDPFGQ